MTHALPVLMALLAQAAPAPTAATGGNLPPKERAQALLKEGSALYKAADFAGALQRFQSAYTVYPSPKLQFNIAQADRELGRMVEAVEAFETFLVQAPDSPPELIAEARQSLAELKPKLAQVRIDAIGGAQATIDDRSLGVTPIARIIWVMPGRHRITVTHPSYLPASAEVIVSVGEIKTVAPRLIRAAEAPAPAPLPAPLTPVLTAPAPPPENVVRTTPAPASSGDGPLARKPWYFWTTAAATAAFTVGAVAAGVSANGKYDDLDKGCRLTSAGCSEGQIDTVKSRALLANVLWILAGASAVATGVTFYIDSRESGVSAALKF